MLSLAAVLTLSLATLDPSARLLTPVEVLQLQDELHTTEAAIKEARPLMPTGFVVGMSLGFSFAVMLLPGLPLLIAGVSASSFFAATLILVGAVLTTIGGVALVVAVLCAVLGTTVEAELTATRGRLMERRDALKRQLEQATPPPAAAPRWVPGVEREAPVPSFLLARF